jgi:hypothetical protein
MNAATFRLIGSFAAFGAGTFAAVLAILLIRSALV